MAKLGRQHEPIYFTPAPGRGRYTQGLWEGGDAPSAPDPVASAAAQMQINQDAARLTTKLNRADQITPFGSLTWTQGTGQRTFNQSGYDTAMKQYNDQMAQYNQGQSAGPVTGIGPGGDIVINQAAAAPAPVKPNQADFWDSGDQDQWTSNYTLSDDQQQILDQNETLTQGRLGLANRLIGQMGSQYSQPMDTSSLPSLVSNVGFRDVQGGGAYGGSAGAGQASINLNGLTALPEVSDATRQRVEEALYNQAKSRLDPDWERRNNDLQTQLANQGITLGSKAFDTSVGQFGRDRNDAYQTALNNAIVGGGAEQSRLFDLALKPRQQEFAERSKEADVSMSNASNSTNASIASAANATQAAIANAQMNLAAQNANNQNALLAAQFNNSTRGQGLQELLALRNQPLQELAALTQGTTPTLPNFGSTQSGAAVNPANLMGAQQTAYQGQLAGYNADMQSANSAMGALGSLGSAALMSNALGAGGAGAAAAGASACM